MLARPPTRKVIYVYFKIALILVNQRGSAELLRETLEAGHFVYVSRLHFKALAGTCYVM